MSKEAKLIWRAAEEAGGLPECPSDMSSPQLASFLYDLLCMVWLSYSVPTLVEVLTTTRNVMRSVDLFVLFLLECACAHLASRESEFIIIGNLSYS